MNRLSTGSRRTLCWLVTRGAGAGVVLFLLTILFPLTSLAGCQEDPSTSQSRPAAAAGKPEATAPAKEQSSVDAAEVDEREEAAWEFRPYDVLVWLVDDNGAWIRPMQEPLIRQLEQDCQLTDPSGWKVTVQTAPRPWPGRLLTTSDYNGWTDQLIESARSAAGPGLDKLLVVRLSEDMGMIHSRIQELDIKTRIWGAVIEQDCDISGLHSVIFEGIRQAFMPLGRIDYINGKDVMVRVRASGIAWLPEQTAEGDWTMVPNTGSPVWIGDHEILMPVILRKDRQGNVSDITAVPHTFLSILSREGPHLHCDTLAMQRAPLGGRSGGRTERMALCVRAPDQSTRMSFISNEKEPQPLRDLEVFSRLPGQESEEASEFLGKSDWQGQIDVPPHESGIRVLYIKSGRRPLAKVPVVPGLYPELSARMPNDERRLYAEGIVKGYQNELMDLLARRLILETLVEMALEQNDLDKAQEKLSELRRVDDSKRFNTRLSLEKKNLLSTDERQRGYIEAMFDELETLSNKHLDDQKVSTLSRQVRDLQTGRVPEPAKSPELSSGDSDGGGDDGDGGDGGDGGTQAP